MADQRFVLLDRDGTIIVERVYLSDPNQVELISGASEALRRLRAVDLGLVVVTNQSGVGRGYFDTGVVDSVHQRMLTLLATEGADIDAIYICPHTPDDGCQCRKPRTELVKRAAEEHRFDPACSFVIGDKVVDIELGKNLGATTFLVRTGYGAQVAAEGRVAADYVVDDIAEAARIIERLVNGEESVNG